MVWNEYSNLPIAVFNEGSFFGELETYKNSPRIFSCIALTVLDVFTIDKAEFNRVFFKFNPSLGSRMIFKIDNDLLDLTKIMAYIRGFYEYVYPETTLLNCSK